jgi:hypothetical protein
MMCGQVVSGQWPVVRRNQVIEKSKVLQRVVPAWRVAL